MVLYLQGRKKKATTLQKVIMKRGWVWMGRIRAFGIALPFSVSICLEKNRSEAEALLRLSVGLPTLLDL
ncbi:hypothetical protein Y1Q_0009187 [Alligator mississippiensis]|uniref:Uncharacterized protein n=1 Tax=Alligator mississippiensis TaxID=8496 RepID=A0A151M2M9_ALLMI|nr:hypothetical protein Y1Q_0009187 [Alligator mississippiensis]